MLYEGMSVSAAAAAADGRVQLHLSSTLGLAGRPAGWSTVGLAEFFHFFASPRRRPVERGAHSLRARADTSFRAPSDRRRMMTAAGRLDSFQLRMPASRPAGETYISMTHSGRDADACAQRAQLPQLVSLSAVQFIPDNFPVDYRVRIPLWCNN